MQQFETKKMLGQQQKHAPQKNDRNGKVTKQR
jgi:hypothetical protein